MIIIINNINGIKPKDKKDMITKDTMKKAKIPSVTAPINDTTWIIPLIPNKNRIRKILAAIKIYSCGCIAKPV